MSCCNGFNAFLPVPMPVVNGDGPIFPVGQLTAKKTFYLNGTWRGTYVLLGSHDGVDFVPIDGGKFDGSANPQQARVDIDAVLAFVRIRRDADTIAVAAIASQLTCACPQQPPPPELAPEGNGEGAPKLAASKKGAKEIAAPKNEAKPGRLPPATAKMPQKKAVIFHKMPGVKKAAHDRAKAEAEAAEKAAQAAQAVNAEAQKIAQKTETDASLARVEEDRRAALAEAQKIAREAGAPALSRPDPVPATHSKARRPPGK